MKTMTNTASGTEVDHLATAQKQLGQLYGRLDKSSPEIALTLVIAEALMDIAESLRKEGFQRG